jgi:hypothetical protein
MFVIRFWVFIDFSMLSANVYIRGLSLVLLVNTMKY